VTSLNLTCTYWSVGQTRDAKRLVWTFFRSMRGAALLLLRKIGGASRNTGASMRVGKYLNAETIFKIPWFYFRAYENWNLRCDAY
jgi:hypothetical protein